MGNDIETILCQRAPKALGNYSHATAYGELIFVSGIASRHPVTNEVPGLKVGKDGEKLSYDIKAETRATLENIRGDSGRCRQLTRAHTQNQRLSD